MTTTLTSEVDYQDLIQNDRINGRIYYDPQSFVRNWIRSGIANGYT